MNTEDLLSKMSLKLGYWKQWNMNNNATVKFDDVDFNKTILVFGVSLDECINKEHFSDWDKYVGDTFIE